MPKKVQQPLKPKRRKRTRWVNRFLKLPASIKAKIEALDITPTQKNNIYKLLAVIMIKAKRKGGVFKEIDLPWEYLQKGWGGSAYKIYLNILISEGIIGCDYIKRVSNNKTGKCYRYWLVYKEEYHKEELASASYLSTSGIEILDSEVFENWFKEDFKQLEMPMERLREVAKARVEGVSLENCRIGNEIEENSIEVTVVEGKKAYSYRTSKQNALRKAEGLGKLLIKDRSSCYIMGEQEYLSYKRYEVRASDTDALDKLERRYLRAGRNATNHRLDTSFTNLPNEFMAEICKANNLKTLDIVNSQIALMARVMPDLNTADSELFKRISVDGTFYESVQQLLGLKSRKEAKIVSFEMLFSARGNRSSYLKRMREVFPSVMAWVDGYKLEHGDNMFAVMLQREESRIFVDGLLRRIKVLGYLCFTKHDSIIYRAEDAGEIEKIAEGYFAEIGFSCKYKIEGYC